jgi:hypothetical protein
MMATTHPDTQTASMLFFVAADSPASLATEQDGLDGDWVNIPDPARKGKGEVTDGK